MPFMPAENREIERNCGNSTLGLCIYCKLWLDARNRKPKAELLQTVQ